MTETREETLSNLFTATFEYIPQQRAAVVTLYDAAGNWSGGGRVECRTRVKSEDAAYGEGYKVASLSAASKGGRLDRFSRI